VPAVGDVYGYKPPRATAEKDCEVLHVNVSKSQVDLKSLVDDAEYKGVSFGKLIEIA
jgi:hypothetical protein